MDFLFDDDETTGGTTRKNNIWIYWVDFEQEEGGQVTTTHVEISLLLGFY
jgi:hypothetical protein